MFVISVRSHRKINHLTSLMVVVLMTSKGLFPFCNSHLALVLFSYIFTWNLQLT